MTGTTAQPAGRRQSGRSQGSPIVAVRLMPATRGRPLLAGALAACSAEAAAAGAAGWGRENGHAAALLRTPAGGDGDRSDATPGLAGSNSRYCA